MRDKHLAVELSRCGLLQYDNYCEGHYHIQQPVPCTWATYLGPADLATGRYYIIVED